MYKSGISIKRNVSCRVEPFHVRNYHVIVCSDAERDDVKSSLSLPLRMRRAEYLRPLSQPRPFVGQGKSERRKYRNMLPPQLRQSMLSETSNCRKEESTKSPIYAAAESPIVARDAVKSSTTTPASTIIPGNHPRPRARNSANIGKIIK